MSAFQVNSGESDLQVKRRAPLGWRREGSHVPPAAVHGPYSVLPPGTRHSRAVRKSMLWEFRFCGRRKFSATRAVPAAARKIPPYAGRRMSTPSIGGHLSPNTTG